jgi:hypothetical protein
VIERGEIDRIWWMIQISNAEFRMPNCIHLEFELREPIAKVASTKDFSVAIRGFCRRFFYSVFFALHFLPELGAVASCDRRTRLRGTEEHDSKRRLAKNGGQKMKLPEA